MTDCNGTDEHHSTLTDLVQMDVIRPALALVVLDDCKAKQAKKSREGCEVQLATSLKRMGLTRACSSLRGKPASPGPLSF